METNENLEQQFKKITIDGLIFSLNDKEGTSHIIGYESRNEDIIIPFSINYEMHEYVITQISKYSFRKSKTIKSIKFAPNSMVDTIEKAAFYQSSIVSIEIPSNVTQICE